MQRKPSRKTAAAAATPLSIRARALLATGMQDSGIHELLTDEERDRLRGIATLIDLPGRHLRVFSQGDEAQALFVVARGAIRVSRSLGAGARQVVAFMYPGDLLGLAENGRYVNSGETLMASNLFRISYASLKELLRREAHLQCVLLVKLAHELRAAQRHVVIATRSHVARRLALMLGDLCLDTPYFNTRTRHLGLPITRADIGEYLGAAEDVVTRAFATLENERVVTRLSSRTLVVPDVARLLRYGRSRPEPRPSAAQGR